MCVCVCVAGCVLIKPSINLRLLASNVSVKTKKIKSSPRTSKAGNRSSTERKGERETLVVVVVCHAQRRLGKCVNDAIINNIAINTRHWRHCLGLVAPPAIYSLRSRSVNWLLLQLQLRLRPGIDIKALKLGNC